MKAQPATRAEIQAALYGRKSRQNLETQLVSSVEQYLHDVLGLEPYRRNIGAREGIDEQGRPYFVRFNKPGMSDIWTIVPPTGVLLEIECKAPHGHLTREQAQWLDDVRKTGAIGLCVTSLEELSTRLRDEFLKRGLEWKRGWML